MNVKRAIGYAVLVYLSSFVFFFLSSLVVGAPIESPTVGAYAIYWLCLVVILLLFAKWYFRKSEAPLPRHGLYLGLITIGVSLLFDALSIGATYLAGESLEVFVEMYTSWEFYVTVLIVLATTSYAGYEFDATFTTAPPKVNTKQ